MKRTLATAAGTIAILCAMTLPALAQTTIKIGYTNAPDSVYGLGARTFAAALAKSLPGRYRFEEEPASKLGSDLDMVKALQIGTLEMMVEGGGGATGDVVPEVGVLDLPFLFRDNAHVDHVMDGPVGNALLEAHTAHDLVAIGWGEAGMRQITTSDRPVHAAADVRGLRMRVPPTVSYQATFKALGADPKTLSIKDVYPALKAGSIDGEENPIPTIIAAKLYEVQKHVALTRHIYTVATFLVSPDIWSEMSEPDKTAFRAAARTAGQAMRDFARQQDVDGVAFLRAHGVDVIESVDRASFVDAVAPTYAHLPPNLAALVTQIRETN